MDKSGSAFPYKADEETPIGDNMFSIKFGETIGLTKREYFAGMMISELARQQQSMMVFNPESIAERAYQVADAMLKASQS